jgi:hypothetical protein
MFAAQAINRLPEATTLCSWWTRKNLAHYIGVHLHSCQSTGRPSIYGATQFSKVVVNGEEAGPSRDMCDLCVCTGPPKLVEMLISNISSISKTSSMVGSDLKVCS